MAATVPAALRFSRALNSPEAIQQRLLQRYLVHNCQTAFGRAYHFEKIRTYADFTQRVPVADYEDFAPWIERIRQGEQQILTHERVIRLVPTSGSTGGRKLIPFTVGLQREFNAAIGPWITDVYCSHPHVMGGPAYWSITPATPNNEEKSAVPIGFGDDASYLGGARKKFVDAIMAAPSELQQIADTRTFQYLTLLSLLRRRELRLISVWHPSFLSLLMELLPEFWNDLLEDVSSGGCRVAAKFSSTILATFVSRPMTNRYAELKNADPHRPETIWPDLKFISCWGDAHAEAALTELRNRFPSVFIQPKGLLATEAFVTIPFGNNHPLALCSHFFEFRADNGRIHLTHELSKGERYEVIVTTAGGLWRYRLRDQVEVKGFVGRTPSLRFLGRVGNVSDRFGEKLSEAFVTEAIKRAAAATGAQLCFALLAPETYGGQWRYSLFVEGKASMQIGETLETLLCENPQYAWCRALGQLQAVRVVFIHQGYASFVAREMARGKRLGDIKPCALSIETDWSNHFQRVR